MKNWLFMASIAITSVARAIRSPLLRAPAHRGLFLLVVTGVLLICLLPEAAFVLPALDAIGLDVATILVALELRHYALSLARLPSLRNFIDYHSGGLAAVVSRCRIIMRTSPVLWLYALMWVLIAFHTFMGRMRLSTEVPP